MPDIPSKEGYYFAGWYYINDLKEESLYDFNNPIEKDLILFVKWDYDKSSTNSTVQTDALVDVDGFVDATRELSVKLVGRSIESITPKLSGRIRIVVTNIYSSSIQVGVKLFCESNLIEFSYDKNFNKIFSSPSEWYMYGVINPEREIKIFTLYWRFKENVDSIMLEEITKDDLFVKVYQNASFAE